MQRNSRIDERVQERVAEYLLMSQSSKPKSTIRVLTQDEITSLNRDGAHLQPNKFYAQFFLLNSTPNAAADPYPFQIMPEALEKFAKSAVGRPFVLGANSARHVRGPKGHFSTAEEIIAFQKQYAAGEIVHQYINPQTGNANVIVYVFPEYVNDVRTGKIPPYVSPLIENTSPNLNIKDGRLLVRDGRILHLQAVDKPGYGEVATIHGTCEGMLDTCMNQLRALGASGKLKLSQFEQNLYDNYKDSELKNDIALTDELSGDGPTEMRRHWAAIIADFEVRTRKIGSNQRQARIAQLADSGEDLKPLAKYLQGFSLKLKTGDVTIGAAGRPDPFEVYESLKNGGTIGASGTIDYHAIHKAVRESMGVRINSHPWV